MVRGVALRYHSHCRFYRGTTLEKSVRRNANGGGVREQFCGRAGRPAWRILLAMSASLILSQGPISAEEISASWQDIFGARQEWVGASGSELSFARYRQLIDSQTDRDVGTAKKWAIITQLIRNQKPENQLRLVHQFFNSLPYKTDQALHQRSDYWASAGEFIREGGDCEDYAIAKYRALVDAGYDARQLRIVLVEDTITREPHAVLAARLGAQTFILDNQRNEVLNDSDLGHYRPIYSINEIGVWRHRGPVPGDDIDTLAVATQSK